MGRTVGLVTIGQSPRPDLIEEYEQALPGARLIQAGALDDLSEPEIQVLAPGGGDEVLVSRLRTGREVRLARRHLEPHLQSCLDRLSRDADLTILLCTGEFPTLRSRGLVLVPQRVLHHVVAAAVDGLRGPDRGEAGLGVLIPDPAQQASAESRWGAWGPVVTAAASPYRGMEAPEAAGGVLRAAGVGLVVMDCIGYTRPMRQRIARITGVPVILASAAVAMIAREIVEGGA
ncbi:MAG TPA: AroM family protein [bacterium]|nr:AroM family protein [bacterium]